MSAIDYATMLGGIVTRKVSSQLFDWMMQVSSKSDTFVDIREFGALPNGTTDNTVAIQKAIDSGLPVYIPNVGTFAFGSPLNLRSNLTMFGAGMQSSVLLYKGTTGSPLNDQVNGPIANCSLSGFRLTTTTGLDSAMWFDSTFYLTLDDIQVDGFSSHGILFTDVRGPVTAFVRGSRLRIFNNSGSGIKLEARAGANNFYINGWTELVGNARYGFEQTIVPTFANQSVIHLFQVACEGNTLGSVYCDLLRASSISKCYFENGTNQTVVHMRLGEGSVGLINGSVTGTIVDACFFACTKAAHGISAMGITGSPDMAVTGCRFDGTAGFGVSAIDALEHQDWNLQGNRVAPGWTANQIGNSLTGVIGGNTWENSNTKRTGHLPHVAETYAALMEMVNDLPAVNGTQQWSPALELGGQTFETSGNTSQPTKVAIQGRGVQGATAHVRLHFLTEINGAGKVSQGYVSEAGLWVPLTAVVLPGGTPPTSGVLRVPNNVGAVTSVTTGATNADLVVMFNDDVTYLLGSDGLRYLAVDSTNNRVRAVASVFQALTPGGQLELVTAEPVNDGETSLSCRRKNGGVVAAKLIKHAAAPPGGSLLLYVDP